MYKIETEYHFITSNENELPKYICNGLCKKAYWNYDVKEQLNTPLAILKCESCNGNITTIKKEDYKVIEFKITPQQRREVTISYLSEVKPEFEEYAKANWVK